MTDYAVFQSHAVDESGNVLAGASVEVRSETTGSLVTIYSGRTGGALANPFTSDNDGYFKFHTVGDFLQIRVYTGPSGAPTSERIFRYVPVGLAGGYDIDQLMRLVPDGSVSAPGFAFANDTNSGFYRIGADNIGVAVGGAKVFDFASTLVASIVAFGLAAGSASAPSLAFSGDTNTGLYSVGADSLGITTGGTARAQIDSSGARILSYLRVGSLSAPTNTTAGDLTSTRLSVGNGAFSVSNGQLSYFSGTLTATSSTEVAVGIIPTLNPASASSAGFRTLFMSTNVNSAQNFTGTIDSGYFENRVVNAGTIGTLDGGRFFGLVASSTGASLGNVTTVNGVLVQAVSSFSNSLTATIASTHGVHVVNPANSGSGPLTLTSQAGVTIESLSAATNNTHLLIGTGTIPTGANYAIYSSSTSSSLLAGSIKSSHATGGVGYATGAGGAVTQATSKSTGVTLDKVCGQITMNNAALNAGTSVSFTLTNSAIAATDVVSVNIASAASADSYTVDVTAVAAGSCRIQVYNFTAGNLSEALVLNFAVIKAVAA